MARALTAEWHRVAPADRPAAIRRWRERRDLVAATGAHYWVFASTVEAGAYLEFIEARDVATLASARMRAGLPAGVDALTELEFD